jgi:hypothetical protein
MRCAEQDYSFNIFTKVRVLFVTLGSDQFLPDNKTTVAKYNKFETSFTFLACKTSLGDVYQVFWIEFRAESIYF